MYVSREQTGHNNREGVSAMAFETYAANDQDAHDKAASGKRTLSATAPYVTTAMIDHFASLTHEEKTGWLEATAYRVPDDEYGGIAHGAWARATAFHAVVRNHYTSAAEV